MLRRVVWFALTKAAALVFALIPRRRRSRAAIALTSMITPLAGAWLQWRAPRNDWCSAPFDEAMRLTMRVLADGGVQFDPDVVVDSDVALAHRAIYVTGHYPIGGFFLRHAYDHGVEPVVVKAFPDIDVHVWGTRTKFDAVPYSPAVLVKVRRRIEADRPALLLIDMERGSAVPFVSDYGSGHIATRVFDFAQRFDIPMFFVCVRCNASGKPVIVIRAIPPTPEAFAAHLREQAPLLRR